MAGAKIATGSGHKKCVTSPELQSIRYTLTSPRGRQFVRYGKKKFVSAEHNKASVIAHHSTRHPLGCSQQRRGLLTQAMTTVTIQCLHNPLWKPEHHAGKGLANQTCQLNLDKTRFTPT
ncbi:hypothetical protein BC938DRAFT_473993 [Jimgerdemannia flammicorona]|uniref:Uncharacterized protein n=1 Tax=Jimgerdemannia flammicorona TaxID=994334 RepID=A0A433Q2Y9_9FUNG|nr:hypothetical protein BC938DRAFT_473993 [Jimgerdemannia flammicorona]